MTPRKNLLAAAAAAGLLVAVTACGSDDAGDDDNGGSASEQRDTDDRGSDEAEDEDEDDAAPGGSFDGLSAGEIGEMAVEAMLELDSLTMSGELDVDGATESMTLHLTTSGDCEGTMTLEGAEMPFMVADGVPYLQFPPEFAEQQGFDEALYQEMLADRWVAMGEDDGADDLVGSCDLENALPDPSGSDLDAMEIVEGQEVNGEATIGVADENGVTAYVRDDPAAPYILKVAGGTGADDVEFSDFDEEFDIQPPAPEEILDLSELAGG